MKTIDHISDEELSNMTVGEMSDLITDLIIEGGSESDMVRAIEHSMVVIDKTKE
jgi:hypothetical protein